MGDLFEKDERYTIDAEKLSADVYSALHIIMSKYIAKGYSVRAIAHVALLACVDVESSSVLDVGIE